MPYSGRAGRRLNYAFMTLSLLALLVLPELHVSDKGLVGVNERGFRFVDLSKPTEMAGEKLPE